MLATHRRARSLVATGVSHVGGYTPTGHRSLSTVVSGQYSIYTLPVLPYTLRTSLIAKSKGCGASTCSVRSSDMQVAKFGH